MAIKYAAAFLVVLGALHLTSANAAQPSLEEFYARQQRPVQYTPPAVAPADAQAQPEAPVSGSHVVTSVSKCYEELGPDESAEIKRNSLTPYADCQKRLRERSLEKKAAAKQNQAAETARNYKRVSDDADEETAPAADSPADKKGASKPVKKK